MTRNKYRWISSADLPEGPRVAIDYVMSIFEFGNTAFTISHLRDDAVFLQVYGIMDAYRLANLIRTLENYHIEIQAKAPNFIDIRIFCSKWMSDTQIPRNRRILATDFHPLGKEHNFRIRIDS